MPGALGKRRPDVSTDEIVKLYRQGRSPTQIGLVVDCHAVTVLKRLRRAGVEIRTERYPQPRGCSSPFWKGGRHRNRRGYWVVRVDGQQILEHRHVMQEALGRALLDGEEVHHLNHQQDDNRRENLWVLSEELHRAVHDAERAYCRSGHPAISNELRVSAPFLARWLEWHDFSCPKPRRRKTAVAQTEKAQ